MKLKKIVSVVVAVCMAAALTACGSVNIEKIGLPEKMDMVAGETVKLDVTFEAGEAKEEDVQKATEGLELTWVSSDEKVATVDAEGNVTAVEAGEADVTLTAKSEKTELSATCHITVTAPEKEIEPTKVAMDSDGMDALQAMKDSGVVVPENVDPETLTWASSDEAVATVDENGHITPVGTGECVITVTGAFLADDTAAASNMSYKGTANIVFLSATPKNEVVTTQETEGNMWSAELRIVVCETLEEDGQEVDKTDKDTTNDKNTTTGDKNTTTGDKNTGSNNGSTSTGGGTTNGGNNGGSTSTGGGNTSGGNNNAGTGNNPNEGGAAGGDGNQVVPGDGSWAENGGDATPGDQVIPPEPVPESTPAPQAPADNAGTGNNPNEGGAAGGDGNQVVPGDGSWAENGGDATPGDQVIPPPPTF